MPNIMQDLGTKIGSEFKTHRLRIEAVETDKQENLVSGTNIKTINGTSVLGSGDIVTTQTTISGNAGTATKLQTARNIALTGDVTGNANFDGSGNISITAAIAANSVALGTDTTGNYVAGNTAGTGITVTGTAGEGWSPTISLTNIGTAGTYRSVTTDAQGRVTAGTNPTTLAGYGITDAASSSHSHDTVDMLTNTPGFMSVDDAIKLNGIAAGAQVNVATNLGITAGTTAGPIVTSSTGTNATLPTASASASGVVTTGNQTWAGVKTFSSNPISSAAQSTATNALTRKDYVDNALASKANQSTTYTKTEIDSVNLLRADKYLAAQNIVNMEYTDGNLSKIQYNNPTNVDYEILNYTTGNLTSINHYVGSVLKGTTTLSYSGGNLISAIFVGV